MYQTRKIIIKTIYNILFPKNKLVSTGPSQTPYNLKYKISPNIINIKYT